MIRKEDVKPGVSVRIDKVECRGRFGKVPFRRIELNGRDSAARVLVPSVPLLLGEVLEILSPPRPNFDGINLVQVRTMTGEVGEIYYTDIHDCCTLTTENPKFRKRREKTLWTLTDEPPRPKTLWDRLTEDDK
jgi:hypothetical protein